MEIREASTSDAELLSELVLEAKSHWGYTLETIDSWRGQLQVSAPDVLAKPAYTATIDGAVVGFYSLVPSDSSWELDNLWVAPKFMARGVGRKLLVHALAFAFRSGASSVTVDADPNAEGFYLKCGAVRLGETPAPIRGEPHRVRPQLVFSGRAA